VIKTYIRSGRKGISDFSAFRTFQALIASGSLFTFKIY
jgi:hypothetical protein